MKTSVAVPATFIATLCPGRWLLLVLALGAGLASVRAQDMDIGIRSSIDDKVFGKSGEASKHGKIYGMLPPVLVQSEYKLVKPGDGELIAALVTRELDNHDFHRAPKGQHPEILITMHYGRGWLKNPYLAGSGPETPGGFSAVGGLDAPTVSITGMGEQLFKEKGTGFEAKLQKAQFEKLFIRVTAWSYPTDPKIKPRMLWHTTVLVDDPDHRDLNHVASEMLANAGHYFDKEIKEEEIDIYKPVPAGRVYVGKPEVVEEPAPPAPKK
jgi:hypothetical protein